MRARYAACGRGSEEISPQPIAIFRCRAARVFLGFVSPVGREPHRRIQSPRLKEAAVKELNLEEVLRIAGGVPVSAALDEITYRSPQEQPSDPVDYAHLLGLVPHGADPA